jgi:hypothetical protein
MEEITQLTKFGYIETPSPVIISMSMLMRFLMVYPSIIMPTNQSIGRIRETLGNEWKNEEYVYTEANLAPLYEACILWIRHVIGTGHINKRYSELSISVDVGTTFTPHVVSSGYDSSAPIQPMKSERLITALGTKLKGMLGSELDSVVIRNIHLIELLSLEIGA